MSIVPPPRDWDLSRPGFAVALLTVAAVTYAASAAVIKHVFPPTAGDLELAQFEEHCPGLARFQALEELLRHADRRPLTPIEAAMLARFRADCQGVYRSLR